MTDTPERDTTETHPTDESASDHSTAEASELLRDDQQQQAVAPAPDEEHGAAQESTGQDSSGRLPDEHRVVYLLTWGALGVACFVGIVALVQFYSHATAAIATFVAAEYESLFLAGFNLVVLFAAGIAISVLVRELAGGHSAEAGR